jgi:hypothetical protein
MGNLPGSGGHPRRHTNGGELTPEPAAPKPASAASHKTADDVKMHGLLHDHSIKPVAHVHTPLVADWDRAA